MTNKQQQYEIEIKDVKIEKNLEEIKAKYVEACTKAWENAVKSLDINIEAKWRLRYSERAEKLKNQAIAIGWVLGIEKEDTILRCDPEV